MNFDDYELSDEVKAKIQADYDADIKGLKAKNSDLIEREKSIKDDLEKVQLDFATAEQDAKIAKAEIGNNVDAYKAALAEKDALIESTKLEFAEKDKARVTDMAVNEFVSSHVSADPAARKYMESVYRDSIDVVDGKIASKDVTKDIAGLNDSIIKNEAFKNYIKADVGSGTGSAGSVGNDQVRPIANDKQQRVAAINQKFGV